MPKINIYTFVVHHVSHRSGGSPVLSVANMGLLDRVAYCAQLIGAMKSKTVKLKKQNIMILKFNMNDKVVVFPNDKGWEKLIEIQQKVYSISRNEAEWNISKKNNHGGFEEQFWVLIELYHEMFFNGQSYFLNTDIELCT